MSSFFAFENFLHCSLGSFSAAVNVYGLLPFQCGTLSAKFTVVLNLWNN